MDNNLALEIKGINIEKSEHVDLGQFHTFNVQFQQKLKVYKHIWENHHLRLIKELKNPSHDVEVAALVMDEGIGHFCYIKTSTTHMFKKVEKSIQKKKAGGSEK